MLGRRFLASCLLGISAAAHASLIQATDPAISWSGRWLTLGSERHATSAGQRFRFMTNATSCKLELAQAGIVDDNSHLAVRVDGGAWVRHAPAGLTTDSVALYEGIPAGMHTVEVVVTSLYRGAPYTDRPGRFMLKGVTIPDGAALTPFPYPNRHVVLLGDSISCGFRILEGPETMGRMDAQKSGGLLAAGWKGYNITVVAVPGMGFSKPGDNTPNIKAIDFLREISLGTAWSPPPAQDVFINLGTNDGIVATPDDTLLILVRDYLAAVRTLFPDARIWVLRPFNGNRQAVLSASVQQLQDPRCKYVNTTGWLDLRAGYDTTDTLHPNVSGGIKYAQRLMDLLAQGTESELAGDLDGDGLLTLSDAAAVARAAAGVP